MPTWTQPTTTDTYANWPTFLQDRANSQAKMFDDGVSWTSLPSGAIRWSSSNDRWEKWNGASWASLSSSLVNTLKTTNNLSDLTNAATARSNLGLGSMATINSPVPIVNGGTGSSDAASARTALGLGTISTQPSSGVNITGGSISNIAVAGTHTFANNFNIYSSTIAGSHNRVLSVGGGADQSSGGAIGLHGNNTGNPGYAYIATGVVSTAQLELVNNSASGLTRFYNNGAFRWSLNGSGILQNDATSGGDIVLNKSGSVLQYTSMPSWNPTPTGSGSMSVGSLTVVEANWNRIGSWVFFQLHLAFTIGGTPSTFVFVPMPTTIVDNDSNFTSPCTIINASAINSAIGWWQATSGNQLALGFYSGGNWTAGSSRIIIDGKCRAV